MKHIKRFNEGNTLNQNEMDVLREWWGIGKVTKEEVSDMLRIANDRIEDYDEDEVGVLIDILDKMKKNGLEFIDVE
jgi:DNA-directed RNA polymerase sigma subunit (sigma70/sigma32)